MSDDTAYVQGFLDQGLPVPEGDYWCPDGVTIPGSYIERAIEQAKAGRRHGPGPDGFALSEPPGDPVEDRGARIRFEADRWVLLSGWIAPRLEAPPPGWEGTGDILIGKGGNGMTFQGRVPGPGDAGNTTGEG